MRRLATTVLLAPLLGGCTAVATPRDDARALADFRDRYLAAFNRCDVDALLSHYAADFRRLRRRSRPSSRCGSTTPASAP